MATVAVIDYGMGNIHSISKALNAVAPDASIVVTQQAEDILKATHVVFPGVGAIRDCMQTLRDSGLDNVICQVAQNKTPLLGVCLGMQALLSHSEENGGVTGLNLIDGEVMKFNDNSAQGGLKIPHMGWNTVNFHEKSPLSKNISENERFYFVHSFFASKVGKSGVLATTSYGQPFTSAIKKDNVVGVQFHPEKSARAGLQFLENFIHWDGTS